MSFLNDVFNSLLWAEYIWEELNAYPSDAVFTGACVYNI